MRTSVSMGSLRLVYDAASSESYRESLVISEALVCGQSGEDAPAKAERREGEEELSLSGTYCGLVLQPHDLT